MSEKNLMETANVGGLNGGTEMRFENEDDTAVSDEIVQLFEQYLSTINDENNKSNENAHQEALGTSIKNKLRRTSAKLGLK
mmetsp:Transcript_887/g.1649  ORF Transcript_887/g.1649 Transcript_887/m.1649 type:complete len:81 (+) Transcript_887:3-245(+)